ncbi:cytoplasmic tRNA 2-thiolation protein 2 isoform X2 [Talpa occidentalis]|nr:cytoplasmic tRNA 2-thiolation protein 2 isoform X2 [Talpa occidentalis]
MVWQVFEGLSRDSAKRLRFVPGVVHVDEGAACGQSPEERAQTRTATQRILQRLGFPWHAVALEEVLDLPPSVLRCSAREPPGAQGAYKAAVDTFLQQQRRGGTEAAGGSPAPAPEEEPQSPPPTHDPPAGAPTAAQTQALSKLFGSVRSLTAKEELLQTLRTHLILHVARAHGYAKVMTGESCTRLAIKLMTGLALGRGAFLAWDTGFSDERHGDVVVLRPMREHTLKEVAFHNHLFKVPSVFTPAVDTRAPEKDSVHRLVEAFVLRLQARFPSTVSTVYRTSEKLLKAPRDARAPLAPVPCCLLCSCPLDIDTAGSATAFGAQAAHLSRMQAEAPAATCACAGAAGLCGREEPGTCLMEQLCYSCRVTMKDVPSLEPLPPYILAEAQLRSQGEVPLLGCQESLPAGPSPPCASPGAGPAGPPCACLLGDGQTEPDVARAEAAQGRGCGGKSGTAPS